MFKTLSVAALLVLTGPALAAHAETLTFSTPSHTVVVDIGPPYSDVDEGYYFGGNALGTVDGVASTFFYDITNPATEYWDLDLVLPSLGTEWEFTGPKLYTGPESSPTLIQGNFTLTGLGNAPTVATTIGPLAATPEPESLALLGTGLVGMFGVCRRRIFCR